MSDITEVPHCKFGTDLQFALESIRNIFADGAIPKSQSTHYIYIYIYIYCILLLVEASSLFMA